MAGSFFDRGALQQAAAPVVGSNIQPPNLVRELCGDSP